MFFIDFNLKLIFLSPPANQICKLNLFKKTFSVVFEYFLKIYKGFPAGILQPPFYNALNPK